MTSHLRPVDDVVYFSHPIFVSNERRTFVYNAVAVVVIISAAVAVTVVFAEWRRIFADNGGTRVEGEDLTRSAGKVVSHQSHFVRRCGNYHAINTVKGRCVCVNGCVRRGGPAADEAVEREFSCGGAYIALAPSWCIYAA